MTFEELGIVVENPRAGDNLAICPKCSHDRKKSNLKCLSVNFEKGVWNCHHCGFAGGIAQEPTVDDQIMYSWFQSRGISPRIVREAGITYDGTWVKFPYTRHWKEVNAKFRKIEKKEFTQTKDGLKSLYGLDEVRADLEFMIIVEGEMDVLSLREAGFQSVVSVPDGAPNAGSKQGAKLGVFDDPEIESFMNKVPQVIVAVDEDVPGVTLRDALVRRIGYEKCKIVSWHNEDDGKYAKDANEYLMKYGVEGLKERIASAKEVPVEGIFYAKDVVEDMYREYRYGPVKGKSTGIPSLDRLWKIRPGDFSVIHGYPSSGKSKFVVRVAVNLAKEYGMKFAFFPAENLPIHHFYNELVEFYLEKPIRDWNDNIITLPEYERGTKWVNNHFSVILPEENPTLDSLLSRAQVQIRRWGADAIVLDPWTEILAVQERGENKSDYIERALSKTIRFTKTNNVHFMVVAHPAKPKDLTPSSRPPNPSEISGSMMWYNKPDNIICIHRPDRMKSDVDIYAQKVRFRESGEHGVEHFQFDKWSGIYKPVESVGYDEISKGY